MAREIKSLKARVKKYEADIVYWEKKHYDTHHELAQIKKKSFATDDTLRELEASRKSDEIIKESLKAQITDFKNKFVDVNNKYREMVSK